MVRIWFLDIGLRGGMFKLVKSFFKFLLFVLLCESNCKFVWWFCVLNNMVLLFFKYWLILSEILVVRDDCGFMIG